METESKFIRDIVMVRRFRELLFYELSTTVVFILHSLGIFLLYFVIIAAIVFTPYMMYVLIKEKRYVWIAIFFFMVVLPYPVLYLTNIENMILPAWILPPFLL